MLTNSDGDTRLHSRVLAQQYYLQDSSCILAILFRRHRNAVFQLCLSYLKQPDEAEDAMMEIFEYLSQHLKKYRIDHFFAWLMIFSRNHCLSRMERKARRRRLFSQLAERSLWEDLPAEVKWQRDRQVERLQLGMARLKKEQRECLHHFYFEQFSYKDIAAELELPVKAVKSHIQNGKRNLRKYMRK